MKLFKTSSLMLALSLLAGVSVSAMDVMDAEQIGDAIENDIEAAKNKLNKAEKETEYLKEQIEDTETEDDNYAMTNYEMVDSPTSAGEDLDSAESMKTEDRKDASPEEDEEESTEEEEAGEETEVQTKESREQEGARKDAEVSEEKALETKESREQVEGRKDAEKEKSDVLDAQIFDLIRQIAEQKN